MDFICIENTIINLRKVNDIVIEPFGNDAYVSIHYTKGLEETTITATNTSGLSSDEFCRQIKNAICAAIAACMDADCEFIEDYME